MGLCFSLEGCQHGSSLVSTTYLTGRGWAQAAEPYQPAPLYCYQTLGHPVCYKEPLTTQGAQERFIEGYQPPSVPPVSTPQQAPLITSSSVSVEPLVIRP